MPSAFSVGLLSLSGNYFTAIVLYCKDNPISLIPVVLFFFLFSAFFKGILVESFHFSTDCRLFQGSPLYNFLDSSLLLNNC